jgi:hypothetical protein
VFALLLGQPPCILRSVIVNLKDDSDTALKGALWSSRGAWLTLRNVSLLKSNAAPVPMDGDAVIHRSNISFLQVLD